MMNRARAAAARAKMHEAIDELFAALEESDPDERSASTQPKPASKPRLVRPAGESDELARAKARRFLRDNGLSQVKR